MTRTRCRVALHPKWIAVAGTRCVCQNRRVLQIGLIALGVSDVGRAAAFWCEALGYELREDEFGDGQRCSCRPAAPEPRLRCSAARRHRRNTRACTWTCTWPMLLSRRLRRRAWYRWEPGGSTGTDIPTTQTSSCWQIRTATVSASLTSATSTAG